MRLVLKSSLAQTPVARGRRLQAGVGYNLEYEGISRFLNWWKTNATTKGVRISGSTTVYGQAAVTAGYLNTDLDLVNPVPSNVVALAAGTFFGEFVQSFNGETFKVTWTGAATLSFEGLKSGDTSNIQNASNYGTVTFGTGTPNTVQVVFTVTDRNNPPRNIKIYALRHESNVTAGEKINPDWLALIKPLGRLRFMDPMGTNGSTIINAADFADEAYGMWNSVPGDNGPKGSVPLSIISEVGIRSGCDVHVNIPHRATDACVLAMATAMRDGIPESSPSVVLWEYSNEVWNFSFMQFFYAAQMAARRFPRGQANYMDIDGTAKGVLATGDAVTTSATGATTYYLNVNSSSYIALCSSPSNATAGITLDPMSVFSADAEITVTCAAKSITTAVYGDSYQWSGFRAATCMKIIRDAYTSAKRARWRGVLATQSGNPSVTTGMLTGVNAFRATLTPANSLAVNDLFDEVAGTGYFAGGKFTSFIEDIQAEPNARVTISYHGFTVGKRLRCSVYLGNDGMDELNDQIVTVTSVIDAHNFRINVNTTSYTPLQPAGSRKLLYVTAAELFDLIDQSNALFVAGQRPNKYDFFDEQSCCAMHIGTCTSGLVDFVTESIRDLTTTFWPIQKSIADANGLILTQYEGGCHFLGGGALQAWRGNNTLGDRLGEYLAYLWASARTATCYTLSYQAFADVGGQYPSKFEEAGQHSVFGGWGGMRWLPSAADPDGDMNPVWLAVQASNALRFTNAVWPMAPFVTGAQVLSGDAVNGQTLSSSNVAYNGSPLPDVTYQWQRDTAGDGVAIDISGATGDFYVLTSSEGGNRVRRRITISNASGSVVNDSPWSVVVDPTPYTTIFNADGSTLGGFAGPDVSITGSGQLQITGSGGGFPQSLQSVAGFTVGRSYRLIARAKRGTTSFPAIVGLPQQAGLTLGFSLTAYETKSVDFVATVTTSNVIIFINGNPVATGETALFDFITVYELPIPGAPTPHPAVLLSGGVPFAPVLPF